MRRYTLNETIAAKRRIPFVCAWAYETQELDLGDIGAGDSLTITYDGQTTGAINQAADMTTAIQSALDALSNVDDDDFIVAKSTGQVYVVQFGGSLASQAHRLLTITPTGFTPGGVDRIGLQGSPATGLTFAAADLQVSKNGGTQANSAGTVSEIGYGVYSYEATAAEFDTLGMLTLASTRTDIETMYPAVEIGGRILRSCTAQAGTASTVTLDASASAVSDFYLPCIVRVVAGTGAGQGARLATAYNGVTKILTVTPDFAVTPDSTTQVELEDALPMASVEEVVDAFVPEAREAIVGGDTPLTIDADGSVVAALARKRTT